MKYNYKFIILVGVVLLLQIGSCRTHNLPESSFLMATQDDVIITSQVSATLAQSETEAVATATSASEETGIATIISVATQEPIVLPAWVVDLNNELYLCIAPDENDDMHLAIVNPISQDVFLLAIKEEEIKGYFWVIEPSYGIGWVNREYDEYSILDFSTGSIDKYPISRKAKHFITHSYSVNNEPSNFSEHAYPVKKIVLNNNEVFFVRQDINHVESDYSKNLSPNERFYVFNVQLKETSLGNYTQVNGFDFQEQQDFSYDIPGIYVGQAVVNWLPNNDTFVEIGDYIIDMSDGSIVQELPRSEQMRTWNSNGEEYYFNPISEWDFYSLDNTTGTEIFVYNVDKQTTEKIEAIDEYFKHLDTFTLQQEFLDNLAYISSLDALGFSYFGLGTIGGYEMSTAGGYCLYSFVTSEINCITDAVEEMLIVVDESSSYTAREEVIYAQWSNSNRFIAFFLHLYDFYVDCPRLLMYDLETESYFFINNNYIDSPLGIWSP